MKIREDAYSKAKYLFDQEMEKYNSYIVPIDFFRSISKKYDLKLSFEKNMLVTEAKDLFIKTLAINLISEIRKNKINNTINLL